MRGEYDTFCNVQKVLLGSPPLARGVHWLYISVSSGARITPACAGSTPPTPKYASINWDHPRLRGEYYRFPYQKVTDLGSPPLARGVRYGNYIRKFTPRITPACAGSTVYYGKFKLYTKDHPRLRGEYEFREWQGFLLEGSPPLARGVLPVSLSKSD